MLRELRIRNLAVIEAVSVPFEAGLNVLTGETGAGKSILVDALLLVRGARAQSDAIRTEADVATVEAVFDVEGDAAVRGVLDSAGLAAEGGELVIRRELARSGRHRAFVNDSPVTVTFLQRLGDHLVDVHGQHEQQRLLEPSAQLDLLDRFAEAEGLRARIGDLHAGLREVEAAIAVLRGTVRDAAQREDLLRFQLSELDGARLRPGEEEELRTEQRRLQHAERFTTGITEVTETVRDDESSALARIARAVKILRDLGRLDPVFAAPADALDAAGVQIEEALLALRELRAAISADPAAREAVEDRLDALIRLKRKYGDSVEAMLAFRGTAADDLDRLARHDELLATEEARLASLREDAREVAGQLGVARRAAATRLSTLVQKEVRALGMERAVFEVGLEALPPDQLSARGLERAEFRFGANPGEDVHPLARVASGGELSRTMLALEVVLATADRIPTMVFDEVDAGIGARTAGALAHKLSAVAARRQVLCVTHLAPIAAAAQHHVRVVKSVRAGRTRATVGALKADERVEEIARMLGGDPPTAAALGHARELLGASRRTRPV
ncbi:MAG TPA: DNA repair protein RecN [Candidatus Acidoferrum sp.]|nr:DNA repair protein RecN [Candidatus Acidoferrum sp.]